jgi:hypothetical protein
MAETVVPPVVSPVVSFDPSSSRFSPLFRSAPHFEGADGGVGTVIDPGPGGAAGGGSDPGTGSTHDDPGGEPTDAVDLEQVAADFEAEAIAAAGGTPPATDKGEGPGAKDGDRSTPARSDALSRFIAKNYGGDEDAFLEAQFESRAETKRLADENRTLRESRTPASAPDNQAALKAALDTDSTVQSLDHEIREIIEDNKALVTRQNQIGVRANALNSEIANLTAELPHIEDNKEWRQKQLALSRAQNELFQLDSEFRGNESRIQTNSRSGRQLQRDLQRQIQSVRDGLDSSARQAQSDAADAARARSTFKQSFDANIRQYNVDPESKQGKYIQMAIRSQLADFLDSLGPDGEGLDAGGMFDAVGRLLGNYAEIHGVQLRSAVRKSVPPPNPKPRSLVVPRPPAARRTDVEPGTTPARVPATSDRDLWDDPEFVKARAERVFSATARSQSRGVRGRLG